MYWQSGKTARKNEARVREQYVKKVATVQACNQDFMWGGANEAKVDQTTEMFFLFNFFNGD